MLSPSSPGRLRSSTKRSIRLADSAVHLACVLCSGDPILIGTKIFRHEHADLMIVLDHQDMRRRGSHIVFKAKSIENALGRAKGPPRKDRTRCLRSFSRVSMRGAMPQNREKVHLDRHKTLTGPLRLLNGVSPGANCPFDGRHQSILGFPMCFKERPLCC
jgi:hypothetical protein